MKIKSYLVGGAVRDQLLNLPCKDFDYAVEAPSYDAMVQWIKEQGTVFLESPQFLTVRAHINGKQPSDFVLCRKEGNYTDGRRPDVVEPGTIYDDLARRDFTVNAIAYCEETGEYIDPHNGREDLKNMLLRCVGKAEDRFQEDALRLLRALRFRVTKNFIWDEDIRKSFLDLELLTRLGNNVSEDRKREELLRCFKYSTYDTLLVLRDLNSYVTNILFSKKHSNMWLMPTTKES